MSQKRLLLILLVALGLAVAYAWWQTPRQEISPGGIPAGRGGGRGAAGRSPAQIPAGVRLDLLDRAPADFTGFRRDLFAPLYAAPPPAPAPPPPIEPPPLPPPTPAGPPPAAMALVTADLARFTFLGFLQKEGEKTIFLSSAEEIFLVKKGDSFGRSKQYRVADLSAERLVIHQGEMPQPIVISLVEQAPLAPARIPAAPLPFLPPASRARPASPASPFVPPPAAQEESQETFEAPDGEFAAPPTEEESLLKPLPRSDFNSLFQ